MRALLGEAFAGLVTSDPFTDYNSLETKRRHLCWAHLVRNLRGRAEAVSPWQGEAEALLARAEELLTVWARFRGGEIDRATMQGKLEAIQAAMREQVEGYRQQRNTLGALCSELHKH